MKHQELKYLEKRLLEVFQSRYPRYHQVSDKVINKMKAQYDALAKRIRAREKVAQKPYEKQKERERVRMLHIMDEAVLGDSVKALKMLKDYEELK